MKILKLLPRVSSHRFERNALPSERDGLPQSPSRSVILPG